jgi:hypothetical protein
LKAPGIALTAALGFFIFWGALSARAQPDELPKWEKVANPALVAAFEKSRGGKPWKFQFAKSDEAAWVLGEPKEVGPRIEAGIAAFLHRSPPGGASEWIEAEGGEGNIPASYVVVHPPPGLEIPDALDGRVYSQPIFLFPGVALGDCTALVDATFQALVDSRDRKKSADLTGMFSKGGEPYFTHVWAIDSKDQLNVMPKDIASRFRYVGIFSPRGETWVVFDIRDGKAVLVNVGFAEH